MSESGMDPSLANRRGDVNRLMRLAKKELVEILRDRRTIITLVMMPLLLYPLLGIVVQKFLLRSLANAPAENVIIVACEGEREFALFDQFLKWGDSLMRDGSAPASRETAGEPPQGESSGGSGGEPSSEGESADPAGKSTPADDPIPEIRVLPPGDAPVEQLVASGAADLGIRVPNIAAISKNVKRRFETVEFDLLHRSDSVNSLKALAFVEARLHAVNEQGLQKILGRRNLRLFNRSRLVSVESVKRPRQPILLTFIPLMLVLMTMTGAVYPAIDLTAGERERGTMEILVAAPVSRMALLFGKFIAVLTVAMLTAVINMVAMTITVYTLGLDALIFGEQGISLAVMGTIFALLIVFAGFFSAVLLGLTSFARSFKEAQAYLIPIMLLALAPGLLSLMPNMEMTVTLALIPLVNIVLLGRDVITGHIDLMMIAVTVISTVFYGLLAMGLAARIFGTDSVLFGGSGSWSELMRRALVRTSVPSLPTAMLFLAVLFPGFIVASGLSARIEASVQTRLWINAAITVTLFVGLPLLFSRVFRLRLPSTFLLYQPRPLAWAAVVLVGLGAWAMIYEIEIWSLSNARIDALRKVFESVKFELQAIPLPIKLVCLALVPALCEEFTFRGFLMSGFRGHTRTWIAVVATSVLFGLFHVFVRDALLFERMLPSTLMGILLGFVCVRTGSVFPGMVLHSIHNGFLITLSHYEQALTDWGIGIDEQQHLPTRWLATAGILVAFGLLLLSLKGAGEVAQHRPQHAGGQKQSQQNDDGPAQI